jgi:hypothetical protein
MPSSRAPSRSQGGQDPEIGREPVCEADLQQIHETLDSAPPAAPDLARQDVGSKQPDSDHQNQVRGRAPVATPNSVESGAAWNR